MSPTLATTPPSRSGSSRFVTPTFLPESFSSAAVICESWRGVERLGRGDLGGDAAGLAPRSSRRARARSPGSDDEPLAVEQQVDEVLACAAATPIALEQRVDHLAAIGAADRRVGQRGTAARPTRSSPSRACAGRRRACRGCLLACRSRRPPRVATGEATGHHQRASFAALAPWTSVMNVADQLAADRRRSSSRAGASRSRRPRPRSPRGSSVRARELDLGGDPQLGVALHLRGLALSAASRMRFLSASASARMPSTSFLISSSASLSRVSYSASLSAACSRSFAASSSAVLI